MLDIQLSRMSRSESKVSVGLSRAPRCATEFPTKPANHAAKSDERVPKLRSTCGFTVGVPEGASSLWIPYARQASLNVRDRKSAPPSMVIDRGKIHGRARDSSLR